MKLLGALTAFFQAAAMFIKLWQFWQHRALLNDITQIDHEIYRLSNTVTPSALMQIESLRQQREQLRTLQSSMRNIAEGRDVSVSRGSDES